MIYNNSFYVNSLLDSIFPETVLKDMCMSSTEPWISLLLRCVKVVANATVMNAFLIVGGKLKEVMQLNNHILCPTNGWRMSEQ